MITARMKLAELDRELKMRLYVYPNQVRLGKISQETADTRIAIVKAMREDYAAAAEAELADEREREKQSRLI